MTSAKKKLPPQDITLTPERWNAFLDAFRGAPGKYSRIAALVGCDRRTAKKLWLVGHPSKDWGRVPMKEIIEREQLIARAQQNERQQALAAQRAPTLDQASAAREEAIRVRAEEAQIMNLARGNAQVALGVATHVMDAMFVLAKRLAERVHSHPDEFENPEKVLKMCGRMMTLVDKAIRAGLFVIDGEHKYMGDPKKLAADQPEEITAGNLEDAVIAIENAIKIKERMAARGMSVITGGAGPAKGEEPAS